MIFFNKMKLKKSVLPIVVLLLVSTGTLYAQTDQIDIIGLIPDVSTKEEVEKTTIENTIEGWSPRGIKRSEYAPLEFLIGGYVIKCYVRYIDDALSEMSCHTGGDWSHGVNTSTEIHKVLKEGFTKKFGTPDYDGNEIVRNRFGVEFIDNTTEWKDKKGNLLSISSISGKVDEGRLTLVSANGLLKIKKLVKSKNEGRKF